MTESTNEKVTFRRLTLIKDYVLENIKPQMGYSEDINKVVFYWSERMSVLTKKMSYMYSIQYDGIDFTFNRERILKIQTESFERWGVKFPSETWFAGVLENIKKVSKNEKSKIN